jgi:hypothetical protein
MSRRKSSIDLRIMGADALSGLRSPKVRYGFIAVIAVSVLLVSVAYYAWTSPMDQASASITVYCSNTTYVTAGTFPPTTYYGTGWNNSEYGYEPCEAAEPGPGTSNLDTTFITNFYFPISINYSGSWNLRYWGYNGTATQPNVKGNLNGSGDYQTTIVTYGVGYVENTLCAEATKLDSLNLTLTLAMGGPPYRIEGGYHSLVSTNATDPSAETCFTIAV